MAHQKTGRVRIPRLEIYSVSWVRLISCGSTCIVTGDGDGGVAPARRVHERVASGRAGWKETVGGDGALTLWLLAVRKQEVTVVEEAVHVPGPERQGFSHNANVSLRINEIVILHMLATCSFVVQLAIAAASAEIAKYLDGFQGIQRRS